MKKRAIKYDDKHIKFNEHSRIGLHNAHIEKIQFPHYVSISANNDNNHTEIEREDFFHIFRNVLNNRQDNSGSFIQTPIIDRHINDNVRPFFLNFDLSSNPIQSSQFVYTTPPNEYNQIVDTSDNFFDAFYDNETRSSDDTNSIPPLINTNEIGESLFHEYDNHTVIYSSDDNSSSDSNA
jgi:hypothetical protein